MKHLKRWNSQIGLHEHLYIQTTSLLQSITNKQQVYSNSGFYFRKEASANKGVCQSHTSTSSFTTTSFRKTATRPSNVLKQSIRAKAPQLCTGSDLFTCETSMQELTTFLSSGNTCLTTKFSPKRPPDRKRGENLQSEEMHFQKQYQSPN